MKRLPSKINVFGQEIDIIVDNKTDDYGEYKSKEKEIHINVKKGDVAHTLIHELMHAMIDRQGIRQGELSPDLEEMICENTATLITEIFSHFRFR